MSSCFRFKQRNTLYASDLKRFADKYRKCPNSKLYDGRKGNILVFTLHIFYLISLSKFHIYFSHSFILVYCMFRDRCRRTNTTLKIIRFDCSEKDWKDKMRPLSKKYTHQMLSCTSFYVYFNKISFLVTVHPNTQVR